MNETYFPALDEFFRKFCTAVKESGKEEEFLEKWGLDTLEDAFTILGNNVQGGYDSHKQSMLAVPIQGSVLSIGPGMGFCVFFLSELYDAVFAAEPDGENCALLQSVARHYQTHKGAKAGDIVQIFHAGIGISPEAIRYWDTRHQLMKQKKLKGSILNFDIRGAGELRNTFQERVSRVYLHKVLSSLSISTSFKRVVSHCAAFLAPAGTMTWSEPEYIFNDILQPGSRDALAGTVKPIFDHNNLDFDLLNYQLANRDRDTSLVETWTLIKVWRKKNEKGYPCVSHRHFGFARSSQRAGEDCQEFGRRSQSQ